MNRVLFLIIFLLPIIGFSQCPTNSIFNSQAEIDALATDYPDCTTLGSLIIEGDDITDLSGLNQIAFASTLSIWNNPLLETLNGLNPIIEIYFGYQASFSISNNASLTDISALTAASIGAGVDLYVYIEGNPMLDSLNGLQAIAWATSTSISNNDSLTNLVGLGNNISELTINENDSLVDLSGLQDFLGVYLTISNNNLLQRFNVQGVTGAEYVTINNNPSLTDISLPENSGAGSLTIEGNISLSVCNVDFVCTYLNSVPPLFAVQISNNAEDCNSYEEVEYTCGQIPRNDDCENNDPRIMEIGETITINNELATTSLQVPSCNDITNRRDLWLAFNSGSLTSVDVIAEAGISLQFWEGDCDSLLQVDGACGSEMLTDIPVTPETFYVVQVWSETARRTSGWFDILMQDGLLSTPEFEFNEISIYPNPAQNELHIQSRLPIDKVEVFNLLSQQVLESSETTLDVSNLTEGLYLVKVFSNGRASTYKIVKQ